jgi:hypothetical protein
MARAAGVSGAGLLPSRLIAGVARDDVAGKAARAAASCAAGRLLLRVLVMVPLRPAGVRARHDVPIECAGLRVSAPEMSNRTRGATVLVIAAVPVVVIVAASVARIVLTVISVVVPAAIAMIVTIAVFVIVAVFVAMIISVAVAVIVVAAVISVSMVMLVVVVMVVTMMVIARRRW